MPSYTEIETLAQSFRRHLQAENKSPKTIKTYMEAVGLLARFLEGQGLSTEAETVTRGRVESFVSDQLARWTPGTASNRYRALRAFFRWVAEEGEIPANPMERMHPPKLPEAPPPIVGPDEIRRLLRACEGTGFEARRDTAVIRILVDTGARNAEMLGMRLGDLDLEAQTILVVGKGQRARVIRYGRKSAQALDRYLRARGRHPHAGENALWIGGKGPLGDSALRLMLRRRCRAAGLPALHPHLFRHSFAHMALSSGANEGDVMQLAGWKSRQMLGRYGASAAGQRAREAHKKFSPGDQI